MSSNVTAVCVALAFEKRLEKLAAAKKKEREMRIAEQSRIVEKVNSND